VNDHHHFGDRHPKIVLLHGQRFFAQRYFVTCCNKQLVQPCMSFFSQQSLQTHSSRAPLAHLQNTVCIAIKSRASIIPEQSLHAVCLAWRARRRREKQRANPPHDFTSPGKAQDIKTGNSGRGRFLVPKLRAKILQRTVRVTFLPLKSRTTFGTRVWSHVSFDEPLGPPIT